MIEETTEQKIVCFHCGEACMDQDICMEDKHFCCLGCKTVYEILSGNNLCAYYNYTDHPGTTQKKKVPSRVFEVLEDEKIRQKLISFTNGRQTHVTFFIPAMHCSSCIWLLEQLSRLNKGIISSRVHFMRKEMEIIFNERVISLRQVAELLRAVGYEPHLSFQDADGVNPVKKSSTELFKIGIAGFCFGNIMMLSFPEYFSSGKIQETDLKQWFSWLNLVLSLPVLFYCSTGFFDSAWKGLKQRFLNIDAPIALAILVIFSWSVYAILSHSGPGYLDSMSGIVFFMLLGRFFQDRTYDGISFERDYKSYFPISVTALEDGKELQKPVSDIRAGARLLIHNQEIIPVDAILFRGKARIDYSFVTGESEPVETGIGELIYAGGRHSGQQLEVEVIREVSQSYLTGLWNRDTFKENREKQESPFIHHVSRYFSLVVLGLSVAACIFWLWADPSKALLALTTPLIVACPCALLLSATFTNGNILRIFGKNKFFVKNAAVLGRLAEIKAVVFDKTGTLTIPDSRQVVFEGEPLLRSDIRLIRSIAIHTAHPFSKAIRELFPGDDFVKLDAFDESSGQGIEAMAGKDQILIGSSRFCGVDGSRDGRSTRIYYRRNGTVRGYFAVRNLYRTGFDDMLHNLSGRFRLAVLSGDKDFEKNFLASFIRDPQDMLFNQKPEDKLESIRMLKAKYNSVLMVGDGLNDAGALKESTVGISVSDHNNNFSPACDAILDGDRLIRLPGILKLARAARLIILGSFALSLVYNAAGLFFALQGELSPVIAAILMPLSSISIVLFTTLAGTGMARSYGFK